MRRLLAERRDGPSVSLRVRGLSADDGAMGTEKRRRHERSLVQQVRLNPPSRAEHRRPPGQSRSARSGGLRAQTRWLRPALLVLLGPVLGLPASAAIDDPLPASATADERRFDIWEFQVEGATRLATGDVERAVYPHLGERRTIADVEGARSALEKAYHERGYMTVIVNIPQQKVSEGVVRLAVTEAPVGRLRVTGSRYFSQGHIREAVPQLAEGHVPNFHEVQKELLTVNRLPERRVTPVLRAAETPGLVDIDLQVKDELPLHASTELNDRYGPNTSHLRSSLDLRYVNLFQRDHSLSLFYLTSPEERKEVEVWSLSYVIPSREGSAWALYAVQSESNVAAVGDLDVLGNGRIYGLRWITPLVGSDAHFFHSLSAGIDYKDFEQDLVLQGSDALASPVHYAPMTLQYSATWQRFPETPSARPQDGMSSTTVVAGFNFSARGMFTDSREFADKRFGASASYLVFRPGIQRLQALPRLWSLFGKLEGQVASGPLISNEQYGAGGVDTVRGYLESEVLGDAGLRQSLELRTPDLLSSWSARVEKSYALAFVEAAQLHVMEALPGQDPNVSVASGGVGLRFKGLGLSVDVDAAHVFRDGANTESGDMRGHFRVNYGF